MIILSLCTHLQVLRGQSLQNKAFIIRLGSITLKALQRLLENCAVRFLPAELHLCLTSLTLTFNRKGNVLVLLPLKGDLSAL